MMHYIIVFENFRFHPPTRKRKAGVFKNLHSVITGHVWKVSLRTTDAFPVVTSLPPFGGREATTGTASAVRRLVEGGPNRCQQRRRVDAANECMMLPLEEFGHLPSQEVQEHCLQFQSLTDLLQ